MFADGRIYFCNEQGEVIVIAPGREYRELARIQMPARILASPAVAAGAIFLRTEDALYRIEEAKPSAAKPGAAR